jgi:hypothetical protein
MTLPLLTSSRLKDARACARLDYYKYQLGYRGPDDDSDALTLGRLVHKGLEFWWRTFDLTDAVAAVRAENADPYQAARAEAMLAGYHLRWFSSCRDYEVIAIEAEFQAPLVNPESGAASRSFTLGGKLDVLARERASGRTLIVEHKTAGEDVAPGSLYRRRLRMDGQVSIYFRGAAALGHPADSCLYDVLAKLRQRPYEANAKRAAPETPDAFRDRLIDVIASNPDAHYARFEVARDSAELAEADADAWAMAGTLRDNARTGRHPRNVDACTRFNRCCAFIGVCDGSESIDAFTKLDNVHPELSLQPSKEETSPCRSLPPV